MAILGIVFSTILAQPPTGTLSFGPRPAGGCQVCCARRRRQEDGPGLSTIAASYARFSSDLQDASSIAQQQRKCREHAERNGHSILPEFQFADEAVSGTKRDREGLNAMLAAARAGRFRTLYFDSLSRLAREFVITLPMLKELVYVCKVRIVSVSEGVDSINGDWELNAIFRSWMHQEFLKTLRAAVLRGQEEAVLNDWSVGDWCLGYGSEPIPGSESGRRGRNPKPRMRVIIIEEDAKWVRQIFHWFVHERRTLQWIVRALTRAKAPKDHRSSTPRWHHAYVRRILRNRKYIGIWPWGQKTTVRNPLTGQLSQEDRPPEEAAKWVRERPHLRLIDDETSFKAQALLDDLEAIWAKHRRDDGVLNGPQPDATSPRHLLQGVFKCSSRECGRTFQVSGANGQYLVCAGYKSGSCSLRTGLPRDLARKTLLSFFRERLFAQSAWLEATLQEGARVWETRQRQMPNELVAIEGDLETVNQVINRLVDAIERGG